MDFARQAMLDLLTVALRTADGLLRSGHTEFWCFAVALQPDGTRICVVSNEADFSRILAAQPQVIEQQRPGVTAVGPGMTTVCVAANRLPDAALYSGHDEIVARLREMAVAGEIVGSAVVTTGLEDYDEDTPEPVVEVELEHAGGWALVYGQPYRLDGGELAHGDVRQFDHTPEVFAPEL